MKEHSTDNFNHKKALETLRGHLSSVVDSLEVYDVHFPVQKIAYFEIRGVLFRKEFRPYREMLLNYLKQGYRFKKYYWSFIERTFRVLDAEMKKDGSYVPDNKYYRSLQVDVHLVLFDIDRETWVVRYNAYIEKIRNTIGEFSSPPRDGKELIEAVCARMEMPIIRVKKWRESFLRASLNMQKKIDVLCLEKGVAFSTKDKTD